MRVVILNSIIIICFTILAVIFEHWWIVLFAYLFLFQETPIQRKSNDKKGR